MPIPSRWQLYIPDISLPSLLLASPSYPLPDADPIFLDANSPGTKYLSLNSYRLWSQRLAQGLQSSGLQIGDRVALFSDNNIFVPVVFMGVIMAGGIFTAANPAVMGARDLAHQLKDCDPLFFLCAKCCIDTGLEAASLIELPKSRIFVFDEDDDDGPAKGVVSRSHYHLNGCEHWSVLLASEEEGRTFEWEDLFAPGECHRTIALNYSCAAGTTTGLPPKGVEITHHNYVAQTLQMAHIENLLAEAALRRSLDRWLCFIPMCQAMAQTTFIALSLWQRVPVFIMPQFNYIRMMECVQSFRITRLILLPPVLALMMEDPRMKGGEWDLSSVFEIASSAGPLGRKVIEELGTHWFGNGKGIEEKGKLRVIEGYGMTELTCQVIMTTPPDGSLPFSATDEPSTAESRSADQASPVHSSYIANDPSLPVGKLLANCTAKLMDEDGSTEVVPGARGDLWISGPTVMKGYWRNEPATKAIITEDGWLITGAVCTVDENNNFHVVARTKELDPIRAHQVAAAELEAMLLTHPSVLETTAIVSLPAGEEEEHLYAYIVLRPEHTVEAESVVQWVREREARLRRITIEIVEEIPSSAVGVKLRRSLREGSEVEKEREKEVGVKLCIGERGNGEDEQGVKIREGWIKKLKGWTGEEQEWPFMEWPFTEAVVEEKPEGDGFHGCCDQPE